MQVSTASPTSSTNATQPTANTAVSSDEPTMLRLPLATWNEINVLGLLIAMIAAIVAVVSQRVIVNLQAEISERDAKAFQKYKDDASVEVAQANSAAASANLRSQDLEVRAKSLAKEMEVQRERAARAEKDLLAMQERLTPRALSGARLQAFLARLKGTAPVPVTIQIPVGAGPEADGLANSLSDAFRKAGWPAPYVLYAVMSAQSGVEVQQKNRGPAIPAATAVTGALGAAGIDYRAAFNPEVSENAIMLTIGPKP